MVKKPALKVIRIIGRANTAMTRDEVRKHNEREWNKKLSMESCPQSCSMRGKPHQHIYEAKLIGWNGERVPDPQYPYGLVGQVMSV